MGLFKRIKKDIDNGAQEYNKMMSTEIIESVVAEKEPSNNMVTVAVPDIKEYLVKEYERIKQLNATIVELEGQLEEYDELKFKYDATLVILDQYSQRCKLHDEQLEKKDGQIKSLKDKIKEVNDELNSYKIQFTNIDLTKEGMKEDIIKEFKKRLISVFDNHKGNLSKKLVYEMIRGAK